MYSRASLLLNLLKQLSWFILDFFMSIAYGKKTGFWIGLSDRISNNHFFWQDNAPLHYTHWDRGEPTSRRSTDNNRKNVVSKKTSLIQFWLACIVNMVKSLFGFLFTPVSK